MHAVMSKIIDHGETIDNQYGVSGEIPTGLARNGNTISRGASLQLKIQSLPILDNLVSLLAILQSNRNADCSRPVRSWPPLLIPRTRKS